MDIYNLLGTRVVLKTTLNTEEVLNLLKSTQRKLVLFGADGHKRLFVTKIRKNHFLIYESYGFTEATAYVSGSVYSCDDGSKINLFIYFNPWSALFMCIFSAFIIYLIIENIINGFNIGAIELLFLVFAMCSWLIFDYKRCKKRIIKVLTDLFKANFNS